MTEETTRRTREETLHREIALLAQPLARLAYERIELSERIGAIEKECAAYSKMASDFATEKQIADENRTLRENAKRDAQYADVLDQIDSTLAGHFETDPEQECPQVEAVRRLMQERKTLSAAMARLVTAAGAVGPVEVETLVDLVKRGATPPPPAPGPSEEDGKAHASLRWLLDLPADAALVDVARALSALVDRYERAGRHLAETRSELAATKEALSKETGRAITAERDLRDVVNVLDGASRHVGASVHFAVLAAQSLFDRHVALEEEVANLRALAPGAVRGDLLSSLRDALGLKPTDDTATVLRAFRERLDANAMDANAKPASPASTYTPQVGDLVEITSAREPGPWRVVERLNERAVSLVHATDPIAFHSYIPIPALKPLRPTAEGQLVRDIGDLPTVPPGTVIEIANRYGRRARYPFKVAWSGAEEKIHDGWYDPEELVRVQMFVAAKETAS